LNLPFKATQRANKGIEVSFFNCIFQDLKFFLINLIFREASSKTDSRPGVIDQLKER
jgi:hypothetical protein